MLHEQQTFATVQQCLWFLVQVPSDRYQGVALAKLMYQDGARAVGLVYEDSTYGYGLAFNFIAAFTNGETTICKRRLHRCTFVCASFRKHLSTLYPTL